MNYEIKPMKEIQLNNGILLYYRQMSNTEMLVYLFDSKTEEDFVLTATNHHEGSTTILKILARATKDYLLGIKDELDEVRYHKIRVDDMKRLEPFHYDIDRLKVSRANDFLSLEDVENPYSFIRGIDNPKNKLKKNKMYLFKFGSKDVVCLQTKGVTYLLEFSRGLDSKILNRIDVKIDEKVCTSTSLEQFKGLFQHYQVEHPHLYNDLMTLVYNYTKQEDKAINFTNLNGFEQIMTKEVENIRKVALK